MMASILTHSLTTPLIPTAQTHTVTFSDLDFQNVLNYLAVRYTPNGGVAPPPDQCVLMWLEEDVSNMMAAVSAWQASHQTGTLPVPIVPAVS